MLRHLTLIVGLLAANDAAAADFASTPDPDQEHTKVLFDLAFARRLAHAKSFEAVQKLAGSKGKITERASGHLGYHWVSFAGQVGFMLIERYEDGGFGVSLNTADGSGQIVLNNFGNFICDGCKPPINICGRRPSWIPASDRYCD